MMNDVRVLYQKLMDAKPLLEQALERGIGTHDFEDIKDAVMTGSMQLWTLDSTAAVTEIIQYPRFKAVVVVLAAGEMSELVEAIPELEEFSRIVGAQRILICGRLGWLRALKEHGFESAQAWAMKGVTS